MNVNKNENLIALKIDNIEVLDKFYVPYFKTGGIIIGKNISMGSSVLIMLTLNIGVKEKRFKVAGKVQMITPDKNGKNQNIGIAFDNNQANAELKKTIEEMLSHRLPNN